MTVVHYRKLGLYLGILLCVLTVSGFVIYWHVLENNAHDKQYIYYANELRVITQRIAKHSIQAVFRGDQSGFNNLRELKKNLEDYLEILKKGKVEQGRVVLPPSSKAIQDQQLKAFMDFWATEEGEVSFILSNQTIDESVNNLKNLLSQNFEKIEKNYNEVMDYLAKQQGTADKLLLLDQTVDLAQEAELNLRKILDTQNITDPENYEKFKKEIADLSNKIKTIKETVVEVGVLNKQVEIDTALNFLVENVDHVITTGKMLDQLQVASNDIFNKSIDFLDKATALANAYSNAVQSRWATQESTDLLSYILGGLLVVFFYIFL